MRRVPLLSGSRVATCPVSDEDVIIRPPPPPSHTIDAGPAVRDALRFPLSGPSLDALVPRGGRVTIVVEPPVLPLPGAAHDPRQEALAAVIAELALCGVPDERQTILVAGGLGRRLAQRDLERLLMRPQARAFHGRVVVHDVEDPSLVEIGDGARVNPALLEADVVVVVTAAETVLHGGPGALLASCDARTARTAIAGRSILEVAGSAGWRHSLRLEASIAERTALIGASLVLDLPRLTGALSGYPHDALATDRVAHSPLRVIFSRLPGVLRRDILTRRGSRLRATAAFAARPSIAHAEALVRGVELRGARIDEPLDALVVGAPWVGPSFPREPANPVTAAAVALGLVLRSHRGALPLTKDGTVVLCHPLTRTFADSRAAYSAMFNVLRGAPGAAELAEAESRAARDGKLIARYRSGKACHPLLPYLDWAGCAPVLSTIGRVIVAGSRDAVAARTLGFVPSHSLASALEMAHGVAGGRARVGVLLSPPYAPILVGGG